MHGPKVVLSLLLLLLGLGIVTVQDLAAQAEPEVDKNSISVHPRQAWEHANSTYARRRDHFAHAA